MLTIPTAKNDPSDPFKSLIPESSSDLELLQLLKQMFAENDVASLTTIRDMIVEWYPVEPLKDQATGRRDA